MERGLDDSHLHKRVIVLMLDGVFFRIVLRNFGHKCNLENPYGVPEQLVVATGQEANNNLAIKLWRTTRA